MEYKNSLYLALVFLLCTYNLMQQAYAAHYQPPNDSVVWDAFHHWKAKHGKIYGDAENHERFLTFKANFHFIHSENESLASMQMALNQFADQNQEEYKAINCGYKHSALSKTVPVPKSTYIT